MSVDQTRRKIQLAHDAQQDVFRALEVSPGSDIALHLLGRWNYEMAGLNFVARTLVRVLFGATLMAGSYQEAAKCFSQAAQAAPGMLVR